MKPTRPMLRYFGGKWRLAPWIVAQFPAHRIYVEPFAGAASVLLQKPRAYNETLNDLDADLVNLFRVLRGPDAPELLRQLKLTPYARAEHSLAFEVSDDPLERARRTIVRSHMTHGTSGGSVLHDRGFRINGRTGTTNTAGEWADLPRHLDLVVDRLKGVVIEQRDALDLVEDFDTGEALLYVDPPYLPATRSDKRKGGALYHGYSHELDAPAHQALLAKLARTRAMVVLSGYPDPMYDAALQGWARLEQPARAHRNSQRTEILWINPAAQRGGGLFGAAA